MVISLGDLVSSLNIDIGNMKQAKALSYHLNESEEIKADRPDEPARKIFNFDE